MTAKLRLLVSILGRPRFLAAALIAASAYVVLYLAAMRYVVFAPGLTEGPVALEVLPGWTRLVFRERGPFLYEPIGVLQLGTVAVFLSLPNLAIALALGLLVRLNLASSYYGLHTLGMRGSGGVPSLIGTLPALLGGAACCAPTLVLVMGLQLTATLVAVWVWLVPVSAALLLISLWWSLHRMPM